jgi:putative ABC transport system permease protein
MLLTSLTIPLRSAACSCDCMLHDLRYAFRALRHKPGFALTAMSSIALGIGANASIFSFADGILLRPLPVPNASQVVTLRSVTPDRTLSGGGMSWPDYIDFRNQNHSFSGLVAFQTANLGFAADAVSQPQLRPGLLVSGNFFDVLGVEPRLGRGFRSDEDRVPGRDAVVVLSHDFWTNEFRSDGTIIGRDIRLNGLDFTVIGVAPEEFKGMVEFSRPGCFVPAAMAPALVSSNRDLLTDRGLRGFTVKGRLTRGVSVQAADTEVAQLAKSLEQANPRTNRALGAAVRTELQSRLDLSPARAVVPALMFGLVAVLLAIACANVANLMLSRARSRSREIAVRLAIGASRSRLLRQLMAESLLIALGGGGLGLFLTGFFVQFASTLQFPGDVPIDLSFRLDARVLWLTAAVSVASAILFGLGPALKSAKTDLVPALKTGEADQARNRLLGRSALVIVQVAGSVVLLVMASQLFRGFSRQLAQDPGFRRDHVLMMSFDPSLVRYSAAQTQQFYDTLRDRVRGASGVRSAGLASTIPTGTNLRYEQVIPQGYEFPRGQESASVWTTTVDENYFETLQVRLVRGRGFRASDGANAPLAAVVNETLANHYWNGDPIGKRLRLEGRNSPWIEVVGVAAAGKALSVFLPPSDALYLSFRQQGTPRMSLLVLTEGEPAALAGPLQEVVRSIDPNLPVFGVRTMNDYFEQRSVKAADLVTGTVGALGILGLALALVGLYAVVAYQVAGRTREIGIRMAIGADAPHVMKMILKQAAWMSVSGVLIGLFLSAAVVLALKESFLAMAFDPLLFTVIPAGLLLTALLAAAIPAHRAARIDPLKALRAD